MTRDDRDPRDELGDGDDEALEGLFQARRAIAPPVDERVWRAVASRISGAPVSRPLPWRARAAVIFGAVAASVTFAIALPRFVPRHAMHHTSPTAIAIDPRKDPEVAIDRAEAAYQEAIAVLESEYQAARAGKRQRHEGALASARAELDGARRDAGRDLDARLRLLDGYGDYMHTLQRAVWDLAAEPAGKTKE